MNKLSTGCTEISKYEIMEWCYRMSQASAFCYGVLVTVIYSKTRNVLKNWVEDKPPEYFLQVLFMRFSVFRNQFVCGNCQKGSSDSAQCTFVLSLKDETFNGRKAFLYFSFANKTVSQVWLGGRCSVARAVSYISLDVSVGIAYCPEKSSSNSKTLVILRGGACGIS